MRQIGNAVPVDSAELLARRLASMLEHKDKLAFFAHFEIDIISALTEQLLAAFEDLDPEGLTPENLTR